MSRICDIVGCNRESLYILKIVKKDWWGHFVLTRHYCEEHMIEQRDSVKNTTRPSDK